MHLQVLAGGRRAHEFTHIFRSRDEVNSYELAVDEHMGELHLHVRHGALHGLHEADVLVAVVRLAEIAVVLEVRCEEGVEPWPVAVQDRLRHAECDLDVVIRGF
jgi:hypothetical protein